MSAAALRRVKAWTSGYRAISGYEKLAKDFDEVVALAEQADELRARVRLARGVVAPLVDWEMGEGSRGENSDPLRKALPLLDLRKPLRKPARGRK